MIRHLLRALTAHKASTQRRETIAAAQQRLVILRAQYRAKQAEKRSRAARKGWVTRRGEVA